MTLTVIVDDVGGHQLGRHLRRDGDRLGPSRHLVQELLVDQRQDDGRLADVPVAHQQYAHRPPGLFGPHLGGHGGRGTRSATGRSGGRERGGHGWRTSGGGGPTDAFR